MHDFALQDALLAGESCIRLAAFAGVFALMVSWELLQPRRSQSIGRAIRWPSNLGIVLIDTLVVRVLFPTATVGFAMLAERQGWGLFNLLGLRWWLTVPLAVVILDLAIYFQHVVFHAVPALWRLHRMHHADLEFDVTTGIRFHPVEVVLSMLIKLIVVTALGLPPAGVPTFEVLSMPVDVQPRQCPRFPGALTVCSGGSW
jgi:sterol desaturase/sphingolipid hydroxylase (fatty acid hydroxylase superfamily)